MNKTVDYLNEESPVDRLRRRVKALKLKRDGISKKMLYLEAERFGVDQHIEDLKQAIKAMR